MATTEFGQTVRRWRDRVPPEAAGLPVGGQRRAAGLRREELALLAGISVDYVTRLEQGRATNPSEQVVEALGRALRLNAEERNGSSWHLGAGRLPSSRDNVEDGEPAAAVTKDAVNAAAIGLPTSGHTRSSNRPWEP